MVIDPNPIEQVGNPTVVVTKDIVLPLPQIIHVLSEASTENTEQEVHSKLLIDVTNDISDVEEQCIYKLPPRSTREVPPRRYDLEFDVMRSRYPVD